MRRVALLLLLLCSWSAAEETPVDRATVQIENEDFAAAMKTLEPLVPQRTEPVLDLWGKAIRGVARDLQREGGYAPALDFYERHLDTRLIVGDYRETCIWAGEEQRGLRTIAALPQPFRDRCAESEFHLHWVLLDFAAMERRAREVKWPAWIEFAVEQRALRERFAERRNRAWWIAIGGAIALVAGAWLGTQWIVRRARLDSPHCE